MNCKITLSDLLPLIRPNTHITVIRLMRKDELEVIASDTAEYLASIDWSRTGNEVVRHITTDCNSIEITLEDRFLNHAQKIPYSAAEA